MPGNFFDTNVLLYVASADSRKADRAEELVANGGTISVQVLNEVANVGRRKMHMPWTELRGFLALVRGLLAVEPITLGIHENGLTLCERYGFSLYDAMIAASALDADCDTLWSEDMQDGMILDDRLRIANPFASLRSR
jgi:predicted nucleic acid-binding protein